MPSVRVKGGTYSNLDDIFLEPLEPVVDRDEPEPSPRHLLPRLSHPVLRQDGAYPQPSPSSGARPRSSTIASRVHAHCTSSLRSPQLVNHAQDDAPVSPQYLTPVASPTHLHPHRSDMMTLEGLQADVRVSSHRAPGIIENSINSTTGDDDQDGHPEHHHDDVVEHLDVIDSQVGAFSSLTNAANAIIIPPSSWYSRKPIVVLPTTRLRTAKDGAEDTEQFEDSLDRHVDDVLKRPSKVRRTFMGVWSFLKTPMGIIAGIYGFLVVFWGAAIVIFLAKIINLHNANTQGFWVEVSSQVETGLFTLTSIGLIPSRVLDTYRIWKIWMYKRKTIKLRAKAGLPQLFDIDDLPDPVYDPNYVHVLTEEEQKDLHRQQRKFQYSQTWYRAHGTETHRAFPINMALWICFLNDGNSFFQIFLCGTMWGLNRFQRPAWTTAILIPASFMCGIAAAVVIWKGGERTKRVEEVKERLRAALDEKSLPRDGQLPQSFSRLQTDLETSAPPPTLTEKRQHLESPTIEIDESMTVPPVNETNESS